MVNVIKKTLLRKNNIQVDVLDKDTAAWTEDTATLNHGIPLSKCYRTEKKKNNQYSSYIQRVAPIVSVSDGDRYFDFNHVIAELHGSCISNKDNVPITPLEFRQNNHDLEFMLAMPELDHMSQKIPVLGVHLGLEQIEDAFKSVIDEFQTTAKDWPDNGYLFDIIREHYHAFCMLNQLPLQHGSQAILIDALADELCLAWHDIVNKIVDNLTLPVLEHYGQRNAIVADVVNAWVDHSSYMRIAKRRTPDTSDFICHTLKAKLFYHIDKHLNNIILQIVQNAK